MEVLGTNKNHILLFVEFLKVINAPYFPEYITLGINPNILKTEHMYRLFSGSHAHKRHILSF